MRRRFRVLLLVAAGAVVAVLGAGPAPVRAAATTAGQVVTVPAASSTSTYATVEAWVRRADGRYRRAARFVSARVGSQGIGTASEGSARTPAGVFPLNQPFGIRPDPGVTGSYVHVDRNDVWTGSNGTVVNQRRRCAPGTCPSSYGAFERLSDHPGAYDYGVFIGYNAPPPHGTGAVRGKGSAFFVHVKNRSATAGCVAIAAHEMAWLLRWLRPAAAPVISIGVGASAYAPIPRRYV